MPHSRLDIIQGDTEAWALVLSDADGVVDLSTNLVNEIAMFMWNPNSTVNIINGTTVAAGSTVGAITFTPNSTQVGTVGRFHQDVRVTRANGEVAHFPSDGYNIVDIDPGPNST
jgi:hypothetical protein